jgi:hypothetical protein
MLIVLRLYLLENRRRRQAPGGLLRRSQMQAIGDDFLSDAAGRANKKRILVPGDGFESVRVIEFSLAFRSDCGAGPKLFSLDLARPPGDDAKDATFGL